MSLLNSGSVQLAGTHMSYGEEWKANARKIQICRTFARGTILDIGCSTRQAQQHCEGHYIGLDSRIINRNKKPDVLSDAHFLPFISEGVDTVLAFDVIEHLFDGELFVAECFRILKPEGRLLVTTPNGPRSPFAKADTTHISIYTVKRLDRLLRKQGLEPKSLNVFNIHSRLLLPLKILPRSIAERLASVLVSEIFIIGTKHK